MRTAQAQKPRKGRRRVALVPMYPDVSRCTAQAFTVHPSSFSLHPWRVSLHPFPFPLPHSPFLILASPLRGAPTYPPPADQEGSGHTGHFKCPDSSGLPPHLLIQLYRQSGVGVVAERECAQPRRVVFGPNVPVEARLFTVASNRWLFLLQFRDHFGNKRPRIDAGIMTKHEGLKNASWA